MCCGAGKAGNIIKGMSYLAGGINTELSKERLIHCHSCEHFTGGIVCGICGCVASAKTRIPAESCPHPKGAKWTSQ